MTKMQAMIDNLHIALRKVEDTKLIMMDTNTNSIFWNKMDVIQSDLMVQIKMLGEIKDAAE